MSKGGGQGSFSQMQDPGLGMGMVGFGSGPDQIVRIDNERLTNIQPMPMPLMQNQGPDNIGGGLGSKGGRSNPYQTDGIVPPPAPPQPNIGPIKQPVPVKGGPVSPSFGLTPIKSQPMQTEAPLPSGREPVINPSSGPRAGYRPPNPNVSSGIGGKGGRGMTGIVSGGMDPTRGFPSDRVYAGGTPYFDERTGRYRSPPFFPGPRPPFFPGPRPPFFPGPRPPVFGPPTPAPGRNTQFRMPFFGSSYGRMNPYRGQFSGYGVPTNIASFAQPHYQPYVPLPPSFDSQPPSMQLPPGQGAPSLNYPQNLGNQLFSSGYGGIGGFGRYNLGLAGSQFR